MVLFPIRYVPSAASKVPSTVEHDMQNDAVMAAAVDMGMRRSLLWRPEGRDGLGAEAQGHLGCFMHGSGSGYEREVLPSPSSSSDLGLSASPEGS
jgi:hypothetical protein